MIYRTIAINPGFDDIKHINKTCSAGEDIGQLEFNIYSDFQRNYGTKQKLQP